MNFVNLLYTLGITEALEEFENQQGPIIFSTC